MACDLLERDGDLKIISTPIDFIGVNYYSPTIVDAFGHPQTRYPVSSSGWQQIYPQGLYDLLRRLQSDYGVEIKITENGIPDDVGETAPADPARIAFLRDHLSALHRALAEGTNVTAYYAWSLLDNFEWARGYTQRWGLVHVDFATLERTPKDSARWYAQLISSRSL